MNLTKKFLWTWQAVGGQGLWNEFKFHPLRRWKFDYCHMDAAVAIELEGGIFSHGRHVNPCGFVKDIEKYNEAALLGWTVLRLHQGNITTEYLERIKQFIERRLNDKRNQSNDAGSCACAAGDRPEPVPAKPRKSRVRERDEGSGCSYWHGFKAGKETKIPHFARVFPND